MDALFRLEPQWLAVILLAEVVLIAVGTRRVTTAILSGVPWAPLAYPFLAPGTILHEVAHVLAARLLRVKVSQVVLFRPSRRGNIFELGSIQHAATTPVRDALISLAPVLFVPPVLLATAALAAMLPSNWVAAQVALLAVVAFASLGAFPSAGDHVPLRGAAPIAGAVTLVLVALYLLGAQVLSNVLAAIVILIAIPAVIFAMLVALAIVEVVVWSDDDGAQVRHVPIFIVRSRQPGWPVAPRPNWRGPRRK